MIDWAYDPNIGSNLAENHDLNVKNCTEGFPHLNQEDIEDIVMVAAGSYSIGEQEVTKLKKDIFEASRQFYYDSEMSHVENVEKLRESLHCSLSFAIMVCEALSQGHYRQVHSFPFFEVKVSDEKEK